MDESQSLNKFMSSTGLCSRREADRIIEEGRVTLNGVVARKGNRVSPGDEVVVNGKPLTNKSTLVYIALNKPKGVTCTTDLKDRDNIIEFVKHPQRVFPIGRLDKASTGLILLTNDGDIVNKILRRENKQEKEYYVKVDKAIDDAFIKRMGSGIPILDTITAPCVVERRGPTSFRMVLTQGLNRQIRRMCEYLGYRVLSLKRTKVANIELGRLPVGEWRDLADEELQVLKERLGYS